jgi:hypothetical protein
LVFYFSSAKKQKMQDFYPASETFSPEEIEKYHLEK